MARPGKEDEQRQKASVLGWDYDQGKLRLPSVVSTTVDAGVRFFFGGRGSAGGRDSVL